LLKDLHNQGRSDYCLFPLIVAQSAILFHCSSKFLFLSVTAVCLLVLCRGIRLCSKVSSGSAGVGEESGENWLNDGSEDNLSAAGHWESHPQDEDELEDIVKCYLMLASGVQSHYWTSIRNQ